MRTNPIRKTFSLFLCFCLLLTCLPVGVFAASNPITVVIYESGEAVIQSTEDTEEEKGQVTTSYTFKDGAVDFYDKKLRAYAGSVTSVSFRDPVQPSALSFSNCKKLADIDFTNLDISGLTSAEAMFNACESLTSLDLNDWDMSHITNLDFMFNSCKGLKELHVDKWDTSNVTRMCQVFYKCSGLTELDVSGWETGNVTQMAGTFNSCSGLTSLDVSSWDVSKVENMANLFYGLSNVSELPISGWHTDSVTNLFNLVNRCRSLTSLDLSGWDVSKVTNTSYMFQNCEALTDLNISGWALSKVTDMSYMFQNCGLLENIDISGWDVSTVTNMSYMFQNCGSLENLDISNWVLNEEKLNTKKMFEGCDSLTGLYIGNGVSVTPGDAASPANGAEGGLVVKDALGAQLSNGTVLSAQEGGTVTVSSAAKDSMTSEGEATVTTPGGYTATGSNLTAEKRADGSTVVTGASAAGTPSGATAAAQEGETMTVTEDADGGLSLSGKSTLTSAAGNCYPSGADDSLHIQEDGTTLTVTGASEMTTQSGVKTQAAEGNTLTVTETVETGSASIQGAASVHTENGVEFTPAEGAELTVTPSGDDITSVTGNGTAKGPDGSLYTGEPLTVTEDTEAHTDTYSGFGSAQLADGCVVESGESSSIQENADGSVTVTGDASVTTPGGLTFQGDADSTVTVTDDPDTGDRTITGVQSAQTKAGSQLTPGASSGALVENADGSITLSGDASVVFPDGVTLQGTDDAQFTVTDPGEAEGQPVPGSVKVESGSVQAGFPEGGSFTDCTGETPSTVTGAQGTGVTLGADGTVTAQDGTTVTGDAEHGFVAEPTKTPSTGGGSGGGTGGGTGGDTGGSTGGATGGGSGGSSSGGSSHSSSGGGGGSASYQVQFADTEHGSVTSTTKRAVRGQTVTVTAKPDAGYELKALTVKDASGKELTVKDLGSGKYSFVMPSGKVTVEAVFALPSEPGTEPEPSQPEPGDTFPFVDVPHNAWYYSYIKQAYDLGLIAGVSESMFDPESELTRGMFVTLLYNLAGKPEAQAASFPDVEAGAWYAPAVAWAQANGLVAGYPDGTFQPDDPVSREQMVSILYRYAASRKLDMTLQQDMDRYLDWDTVSGYAKDAAAWAVRHDIMQGTSKTTLSPNSSATRAEAATILLRFQSLLSES